MKIGIYSKNEDDAEIIHNIILLVLEETNVDAEIKKTTDEATIKSLNLSTPAFTINDKVIVSGRIPTKEEIRTYILIKSCRYCYGNE